MTPLFLGHTSNHVNIVSKEARDDWLQKDSSGFLWIHPQLKLRQVEQVNWLEKGFHFLDLRDFVSKSTLRISRATVVIFWGMGRTNK